MTKVLGAVRVTLQGPGSAMSARLAWTTLRPGSWRPRLQLCRCMIVKAVQSNILRTGAFGFRLTYGGQDRKQQTEKRQHPIVEAAHIQGAW